MCVSTERSTVTLPFSVEAPQLAREFLAAASCTAHVASVLDDAILLVSEAITNAVLHGGPAIVLAVDCTETSMEIRVRDGANRAPLLRNPADLDPGGRGMLLIDLLSDAWGVEPMSPAGKEVWFRLTPC